MRCTSSALIAQEYDGFTIGLSMPLCLPCFSLVYRRPKPFLFKMSPVNMAYHAKYSPKELTAKSF